MKKYLLILISFVTTIVAAESMTAEKENLIKLGEEKSGICAACHGAGGTGVNPMWPKLAGQSEGYIKKQLLDFKADLRKDPVMSSQAALLSEKDISAVAAYFSSQNLKFATAKETSNKEKTEEILALGESIYRGGDLDRNIAACAACHGPTGEGIDSAKYPAISGQYADYVQKQLKAFRVNPENQASTTDINSLVYRDNDPSAMMRNTVEKLTDKEIEALSFYIQGLRP